jgi:hypothetical protein
VELQTYKRVFAAGDQAADAATVIAISDADALIA